MGLSAAVCRFGSPRPWLFVSSIWSGRGTEGMRFIFPASFGIFVPSLAMSKRSPPLWASWEDILICLMGLGVGFEGGIGLEIVCREMKLFLAR